MITISLCMIVKNEEKVLRRCLDSVADLVEEMIIVDTGSTDGTMRIAAEYPHAKLYEFAWIDDFSAARNFAFSKATQEYIYSADADEVLDEENRKRFQILKQALLPEVEIVQMKYGNQLQFGTVYNFDEEYRPKLFKRLRSFVWQEAIHETINITPVIYDSDVVITHMPEQSHAGRDFQAFERLCKKGERLSKRLHNMYAKELFIAGTDEDFLRAGAFFEESAKDNGRDAEEVKEACLVAAAAARRAKDAVKFFKYAVKVMADGGCAEICYELGEFYYGMQDYEEAVIWYYNACYETEPVLAVKVRGKETLKKLAECYEHMGLSEEASAYRQEAEKL
ncbi:MAG: glycosyltransferase [Lachnospiraceae bacterium]